MNLGEHHPLDKLINDDSLIMLEAMIPFVNYRLKRLLIIYIKYREFTLIMKNLENFSYLDNCGFNKSTASQDDMLEALLSTMSPDAASNISNAKRMFSMMQAMENTNVDFRNISDTDTISQNENEIHRNDTSLYESIMNIIETEKGSDA